jgi:alkanesulfonate monooxygenase SsuD/methylene tetrahydromethanopterin reductase-like flavin-dependent oxidoreductase (luciferase family)
VARPLRVGVQLPEVEREVPWPELVAMARTAEAVGLDSLWVGDHLLYDLPGGPRGPWEAWTSLAALAAVTKRVALGPLVACTAFRPPAVLAKQAATVDAISGGRLVLGLGAGWNRREFEAFGLPFDHRVDRFAEAFSILRRLLREGRVDHHGRWYRVSDCVLHPRGPRPGGPKLMVGSVGPRMLRLTLPHVDAWNAWWSDFANQPEGFARRNAQVDEVCAEVGRDPAEVERSAAVLVGAPGGTGRVMGGYPAEPVEPIRGDPAEVAERLAAFAPGAGHLQVVLDPITVGSIEWLGQVVALLDTSVTARGGPGPVVPAGGAASRLPGPAGPARRAGPRRPRRPPPG